MFRSLIIIIEIGLLVALLQTPFVQYMLSDVQQTVSNWMTDVSHMAEQRQLQSLRDSIKPMTAQMKDYQKDYLNEVTSSRFRLEDFNHRYCESNDKNPFVYGKNLQQLCSAIKQTGVLKS